MTSFSWLWILLGFLLPLLLFLGAFVFFRWGHRLSLLLACAVPLASLLTVVSIVFAAPYWENGTQVVWTDVSSAGGPLIVGGKPEESAVGWPGRARGPKLIVSPTEDARRGTIEISEGGAFVINDATGEVLNGSPLPVGGVARLGDYSLRVNRLGVSLLHPLAPEIEVLDANGRALAAFSLRADRTRSVQYLIAGTVASGLEESKSEEERERAVAERDKLEQWAAGIWVFRNDTRKVYVLARDEIKTVAAELPTRLTVRWANLRLPVKLSVDRSGDGAARTSLAFGAPWRLSSPLPPARIAGCPAASPAAPPHDLSLSVTDRPRPCESSLVLPFGSRVGDFWQQVSISPETHKFTSPGAQNNEERRDCPPGVMCEREGVGSSQLTLQKEGYWFGLATVKSLPHRGGILVLLLLSWAVFVLGVLLAYPRVGETTRWVMYSIALVSWDFLAFRVLLSFRYALDPASLDVLAIDGVARAFFGLTLVPGLLLLVARLRCDRYERPGDPGAARAAMRRALGYLLVLLFASSLAYFLPSRLWPNLPASYYVSLSGYLFSSTGLFFTVILLGGALLLMLHTKFLYQPDPKGTLVKLFVSPMYSAEKYMAYAGRGFWSEHLKTPVGRLALYFLFGLFFFGCYVLIFLLARVVGAGDKTAQEMSVPIFFCWLALLWIGLRLFIASRNTPLSGYNYLIIALSAIAMLTAPAVLLPVAIGDFGSILPVLALLLPLAWLLVVTLPWKARLGIALAVVLIFAAGLTFYQNLEGIIPFQKQLVASLPTPVQRLVPGLGSQGRLFARLLNYKKGSQAQRWAVSANSVVGGEGLPYQELLNGNHHTWENRALAHLGGPWGLGYGEAPTRESQVRQDTLQYDSVFSFFVASEFGFVGGMLLLLMYAVPLAALFVGGRERFDAGYAIAFIVASAFVVEALYHAGMNLGAFPLTGRNLPLLSVNSPSDLLRWTFLLGLMISAIFWRHEGQGRLKDEARSLISEPPPAPKGVPATPPRPEPLLRYSLIFAVIPVIVSIAVLSSGLSVLRDETHELSTYNYETILKDVQWYLNEGIVTFDPATMHLRLNTQRLEDADVRNFIEQEVLRFNALDEPEREEEFSANYLRLVSERLRGVSNLQQYDAALGELSRISAPEPRRSVFALEFKQNEDGETAEARVVPNRSFNVNFSFQNAPAEGGSTTVLYGDQLLLGPAWVAGRYRTVLGADAKLPWAGQLRSALIAESERLKRGDATETVNQLYGRLTLDPPLHEAAQDFVAAKGLGMHEKFLQAPPPRRDASGFVRKLPPRLALSIISLPGGEALALGGWPRMDSTRRGWGRSSVKVEGTDKGFWVPSLEWLDSEAPRSFRARYGGDRNFDHALVMGSSTKPLWAAAVLKLHPDLDDLLLVRGARGTESEAFGLKLSDKGWALNSHTDGWVNFDDYLKTSDNRYHVRLGLLGLARDAYGPVQPGGPSSSVNESLTGKPEPWKRYPAFLQPVQVSGSGEQLSMLPFKQAQQKTGLLAATDLANALRGMFSIGVGPYFDSEGVRHGEFDFRRSFWTKNENDDLTSKGQRVTHLFNSISPEAPDFAFDELSRPRDYITMLLGGGDNLWSNVDLASAFASCLTGRPVVAHIVANDRPVETLGERKALDPRVARRLHDALGAVVSVKGGTAFAALGSKGQLDFLKPLGIKAYAKTGTLRAEEGEFATSRIVLALIRWKDESAGIVDSGLVFSLVVEEGKTGTAADWIGEFINANQAEISRLLGSPKP